jgi:hypothetical protein
VLSSDPELRGDRAPYARIFVLRADDGAVPSHGHGPSQGGRGDPLRNGAWKRKPPLRLPFTSSQNGTSFRPRSVSATMFSLPRECATEASSSADGPSDAVARNEALIPPVSTRRRYVSALSGLRLVEFEGGATS